ncbi:glycosyltransferase family 2 protein [Chryseobacterium paridis]|uniref:Glycosyltransferase n=1 Tax=Chryseobacterium paridis TaxID=2800328 RepID=A0ABS1FPQ0_9FLAO|nr:glycosyltransferase [Chryseobacterium paridis]MBK1894416.1 glycosyltransferase [Chryseobacterium paridis]
MMEVPLVTVVVISYNHSAYIKECLDSIKNQTYSNIQLIVGDDASQDNSVSIFENWLSDNNFLAEKKFHSKNTGLAEILNECIKLAKGKYIKLIAADDFLHPEAIEKSVEELEKLGNNFGMVFTDTYGVDENSNRIPDIADYDSLGNIDKDIFRKQLIKGNRIAALTVVMRKEALIKTGEYKSDFITEDYFRWLKINALYYIAYIPQKLAYYRIHESNLSSSKKERIDIETLILQMMFDKDGDVKDKLNGITQKQYIAGEKMSLQYIEAYKKYPFNIKRLSIALQYKVPVFLYKFLNKII